MAFERCMLLNTFHKMYDNKSYHHGMLKAGKAQNLFISTLTVDTVGFDSEYCISDKLMTTCVMCGANGRGELSDLDVTGSRPPVVNLRHIRYVLLDNNPNKFILLSWLLINLFNKYSALHQTFNIFSNRSMQCKIIQIMHFQY